MTQGQKIRKNGPATAAAVLLVLVAVFYLVYAQLVEKPTEGAKQISVEIVFDEKTSRTAQIQTDAEYLKEALEEVGLIAGTESEYGFFITEVDGKEADSTKEEWWALSKDGQMLTTGVSDTPIHDQDHFELVFTVGFSG